MNKLSTFKKINFINNSLPFAGVIFKKKAVKIEVAKGGRCEEHKYPSWSFVEL